MLFLAMQVRVMAACMESQIDKQEYTASAQSRARDGTGGINQTSDVCGGSQPCMTYQLGQMSVMLFQGTPPTAQVLFIKIRNVQI